MGHDTVGAPRRTRLAAVPWHVVAPVVLYLLVSPRRGHPVLHRGGRAARRPRRPVRGDAGGGAQQPRRRVPHREPARPGRDGDRRHRGPQPAHRVAGLPQRAADGPGDVACCSSTARPCAWARGCPTACCSPRKYWLGTLLLLLAAPAWFRALTGSRWIGWFAAALILFSPANAWWSGSHANLLGFTLAGAVALQRASRGVETGRWWQAAAWTVAGAWLLVRTPLFYPPWAVVIVPIVLLGTVAALLAASPLADGRSRRSPGWAC